MPMIREEGTDGSKSVQTNYIVTCYLLTRRIILWVADFVSRFIGYTLGGVYNHLLITLPITSHEPATSSGSSSAPSWRKPLLRIFRDELLVINSFCRLLWRTPIPKLLSRPALADCYHQTVRDELIFQTP
jgi:hypothetical protein